MMKPLPSLLLLGAILLSPGFQSTCLAKGSGVICLKKIDYTQTAINPGTEGFWVGPLGIRVVLHHGDAEKGLAPQMWVNIIEKGAPADGKLKRADVILGFDGKRFSVGDPRIEMGNRIIAAEAKDGKLSLDIWRPEASPAPPLSEEAAELAAAQAAADAAQMQAEREAEKLSDLSAIDQDPMELPDVGMAKGSAEKTATEGAVPEKQAPEAPKAAKSLTGTPMTIAFEIPVLGPYSDTSPRNCPRTEKIIDNAVRYIIEHKNFGRLSCGALALLATGEKENIAIVRQWMLDRGLHKPIPNIERTMLDSHYHSWYKGYAGILLGEYVLLTGDKTFFPGLRDNAIRISLGQDDNGLWEHGFAKPYLKRGKSKGRSIGYGAMNPAGLACFTAIALAKKAGVDDPRVDQALAKAARYFRTYVGKGRIGYGFHGPSPGQGSNGKNSIAAAVYAIIGDYESMRYFSKCSITYRLREGGHGGNFLNNLWGGLGCNIASPEGAIEYYKTRRWYCTLVRSWDGSFKYQYGNGSTYNEGKYNGNTGAYLLNYLSDRRKLYITGKGVPKEEMLTAKDVEEANYVYSYGVHSPVDEAVGIKRRRMEEQDNEELYALLSSWASGMRVRAARELAKRNPDDLIPRARALLRDGSPEGRLGAARVAEYLREKSKPLWPDLFKVLRTSDDYYLCKLAATTVRPAGVEALPALLANATRELPNECTPERLQAINSAVTGIAWGNRYASGRHPLKFAAEHGLDQTSIIELTRRAIAYGHGWAYCIGVRSSLTLEEAVPLLDALLYNATIESSNVSLGPFTKWKLEEGLAQIAEMVIRCPITTKSWNPFAMLHPFGGAARPYLPRLKAKLGGRDTDQLAALIRHIEQDKNPPKLVSAHDLLRQSLEQRLAGLTDKQALVKELRNILHGPSWQAVLHAVTLEKLAATDKEAAFEDVLRALGPEENYRERMAVKLATRHYPTGRWVDAMKIANSQQLAGILHVLRASEPAPQASNIAPRLSHGNLKVRLAAYGTAGRFGGENEAQLMLKELTGNPEPNEYVPIELAIRAIHERKALSRDFFKIVEAELHRLAALPLTGWGKYDWGKRCRPVGGILRPDFACIRLLPLGGDKKPLEKLKENPGPNARFYDAAIDYALVTMAPLRLVENPGELGTGKLDATELDKLSLPTVLAYCVQQLEEEKIPARIIKPLTTYLLARAKTEHIGDSPHIEKIKAHDLKASKKPELGDEVGELKF